MVILLVNVYCTKELVTGEVRKYGPYGPYYYEYWWGWDEGQQRMETKSRYIGIDTPEELLALSWGL